MKKLLSFVIGILIIASCKNVTSSSERSKGIPSKEDSLRQITERYSTSEWKNDILERIRRQVGEKVAAEFASSMQKLYKEEEMQDFRRKILSETLSPGELSEYAKLLSTEDGKSLAKKFYFMDEQFRDAVFPELAHIMAGKGQTNLPFSRSNYLISETVELPRFS